jgi:hypothetical protein
MIRTQTEIRHVEVSKFPNAGWLGAKFRELIVSKIKREKPKKLPSQQQMEALRKKYAKP